MFCHDSRSHPFIEGVSQLSSIIKSISLDPQTAQISKGIPNFSRFVRECLLRYDALHREPICQVERMEYELTHDRCIPNPERICMKHWPYGPPKMKDWRLFRCMIEMAIVQPDLLYETYRDQALSRVEWTGSKEERCQLWIDERAKLANTRQIDFADMKVTGNAKTARIRRKSSWLPKFWDKKSHR